MRAQFADISKEAFSFLEGAGFRLACDDAHYLRYESSHSVVEIHWDARSGELEAFVGLQSSASSPQDMYSLTDVLTLEGVPGRKMPPQVSDENRLRPFVSQLADELRAHARPALAGDGLFFRRLETLRHANAEATTKGLKLQQIRSELEHAWRDGEFKKVVSLLASVESDLSKAEKAKLEYARRHQSD